MSWLCFLLWVGFSTQRQTPDVSVSCFVSEVCLLPCSFQPDGEVTIEWFKQDEKVLTLKKEEKEEKEEEEDDDEDGDGGDSDSDENDEDSSEELDQSDERISVSPALVSLGNATLILRGSSLKDRGTYRCEVTTPQGAHHANVISTSAVASSRPSVLNVCRWDLDPVQLVLDPFLNKPSLEWSFSDGPADSHILTYDSRSGQSTSGPDWGRHAELDGYRVPFGDGSLRLMDPIQSKHSGSYTCRFSVGHNTHTDRSDVVIDGPARGITTDEGPTEKQASDEPSYWWIAGLVIAGLALAVVGLLVYLLLNSASVLLSKTGTINCVDSDQPVTIFTWRFNHSQVIVEVTSGSGLVVVMGDWRPYVKEVSATGSLTLQDVTSQHQGVYSCEARNSEGTNMSNTFLEITDAETDSQTAGATAGVIVGVVLLILLVILGVVFMLRKGKKLPCFKKTNENTKNQTEETEELKTDQQMSTNDP